MSGGSKIVDLRVSDIAFAVDEEAAPARDTLDLDEYPAAGFPWGAILGTVAVLLALGWIQLLLPRLRPVGGAPIAGATGLAVH